MLPMSRARFVLLLAVVLSLATIANADEPADTDRSVRQEPRPVAGADVGVGRWVPDVRLVDLNGHEQRLSEFSAARAVVIAMTSTSCPLSQKYLAILAELENAYRQQGVQFIYLNPTKTDKLHTIRDAIQRHSLSGVYVHDESSELARALRPRATTECFVLDRARTLVYRGAVDDQHGLGYSLDVPRHRYLADALDAVLGGHAPATGATTAPGCELEVPTGSPPGDSQGQTYHNRISRIVQTHCGDCHRDGGVAPFSLAGPDDLISHAAMIRAVVERGAMPPWFAAPAEQQPSPWANDRSLPEADKTDLLAWLASDRPLGAPEHAPLPRVHPTEWAIGQPDAVFEFDRTIPVKANGTMPYRNVVIETNLDEDRWVQAIEVRPGAPAVVHHVLVFVAGSAKEGPSAQADAEDPRRGYWGLYVPGNSVLTYPEGVAKRLPKGARLVCQMHYTPNGTATEDRTRIGVSYAKQPPRHEVHVAGIVNASFRIPAGAENHRVTATIPVPSEVQLLGFLPHMHLRGKAARFELETGHATRTLLDVPRYDFNWQLLYRYREPLTVSPGAKLRYTAWYDNSDKNPANPDPTRVVRWGPQTYDEMCLGYVEYIVPGEKPGESRGGRSGLAEIVRAGLFQRLDRDASGTLSREEVRTAAGEIPRLKRAPELLERAFERLDKDGDGELGQEEFEQLRDVIRGR